VRDEGEATSSEGANQKGKRTSFKTRPTHRLGGPATVVSARERKGSAEPAGPTAEWAARSAGPKARKKEFLN
jgi:hypothetical protein